MRRQRATLGVALVLFVSVVAFLVWSATLGEWRLAGMLVFVGVGAGALAEAARRGLVRVAAYALSLLALVAVVGGALLRGHPGYAPFYLAVPIVLAAVTLEPRDARRVFVLGLLGELVVALMPHTQEQLPTIGGVYAEGLLLYLIVGVVALATTSSVARLVSDLLTRDSEAVKADERADALAEQLAQSQRMESLGRLAGGVAHDFNNLLAVMQTCTSMLGEELKPGSTATADLKDLSDAITRGAALTRQLLAFSRRDVAQPAALDLHGVVEGMRDLLQRLVGPDITLKFEASGGPWPLWASASQLEQVMMNLAVNARDAMSGQGALEVRIERTQDARGSSWCRLSVRDSGPGIAPDVKARLFEPFFTTKAPGKGTGLGLSTVYGIVTQLGGQVDVDSEVGKGATFLITLPALTAPGAPAVPAPVPPRGAGALSVVVVDDEPLLRNLMARILAGAGTTVRTFPSAEALLADSGAYDVLVTDINLTGKSGVALAEQLRARQPALRVVLVSGFTADPAATARLVSEGAVFLAKPFESAALIAAVTATPTPVARAG